MNALMWPCSIEILDVGPQDTMQLLFMEDQHVVQTLSSHAAQKAFTDRIGLWGVIGCFEDLDAARGCNPSETGPELPVIITDKIPGYLSIGSRLP
jgi:hypothetical protein